MCNAMLFCSNKLTWTERFHPMESSPHPVMIGYVPNYGTKQIRSPRKGYQLQNTPSSFHAGQCLEAFDALRPTFVMPMWAFDQFIVTPEGVGSTERMHGAGDGWLGGGGGGVSRGGPFAEATCAMVKTGSSCRVGLAEAPMVLHLTVNVKVGQEARPFGHCGVSLGDISHTSCNSNLQLQAAKTKYKSTNLGAVPLECIGLAPPSASPRLVQSLYACVVRRLLQTWTTSASQI